MGLSDKKIIGKSPPRVYTIDDELLGSIMAEMTSLKNTVVELQHHLIGVS